MQILEKFQKRSATVLRLSKGLGISPVMFVARYAWLAKVKAFSEAEIFAMALMDPAITFRDLKDYRSKKIARPVYRSLNASKARKLIDDKDLFHQECDKHGLAAVPVVKRLGRDDLQQVEQELGESIPSPAYEALVAGLPDQFVVKPSLGYHGDGILFLKKKEGAVTDWDGRVLTPIQLLQLLQGSLAAPTMPLAQGAGPSEGRLSPDSHILLIQPLIKSHERLQALSGREQVQSLRVCTTLDSNGEAHIHFVFFKLLAGTNMQDNFSQGTSGNMLSYIDKTTGEISRVIARDKASGLMRIATHHPDTNAPFAGFTLPFWKEACELALRAAKAFNGTGAVGWDIGITPDGPMLLEGNGTWDPLAPLYRPFPSATELSSTRPVLH